MKEPNWDSHLSEAEGQYEEIVGSGDETPTQLERARAAASRWQRETLGRHTFLVRSRRHRDELMREVEGCEGELTDAWWQDVKKARRQVQKDTRSLERAVTNQHRWERIVDRLEARLP